MAFLHRANPHSSACNLTLRVHSDTASLLRSRPASKEGLVLRLSKYLLSSPGTSGHAAQCTCCAVTGPANRMCAARTPAHACCPIPARTSNLGTVGDRLLVHCSKWASIPECPSVELQHATCGPHPWSGLMCAAKTYAHARMCRAEQTRSSESRARRRACVAQGCNLCDHHGSRVHVPPVCPSWSQAHQRMNMINDHDPNKCQAINW